MESDTETQPSRLGDAVTVVQTVLKDPVREAVREAIEEERRKETTESVLIEGTTGDDRSRSPRLGRVLGVVAGLAAVTYLIRRRRRPDATESEPATDPSSMAETGIDAGRPTETQESSGPEDETNFGTETSDEPGDEGDRSVSD